MTKKEIVLIDDIETYNNLIGLPTRNKLISVIDFAKVKEERVKSDAEFNFNIYGIFLKGSCGEFPYGLNNYDFNEGTIVFVGPGQIIGMCRHNDDKTAKISIPPKPTYGILFSPDLVAATSLSTRINDYHFFSYELTEALHMSAAERRSFMVLFRELKREVTTHADRHSLNIIASTLDALLTRCLRFYDRQFSSRQPLNEDVLSRLERLISDYFASGEAAIHKTPNVGWCARQLYLSPNYFGDLIKRCIGITPQTYLQRRIINEAKRLIGKPEFTFSEIAYRLGFKYPHHLSRMFKKQTGMSPSEYRQQLLSSK